MTLEELIGQRYISVRKHPDADLWIYNYTPKTQYEYVWNEHTLECRGLIKDGDGNVVARPFRKFFNYSPDMQLPQEPFEVFDKLDGSLGILYWHNDRPFIATRGSFESEQAVKANEILSSRYRNEANSLDRTKTYLFEIIYPDNQIVVNYGEQEDLIHLATIDTATGKDDPLIDVGFPLVTRYDVDDLASLKSLEEDNREGFVVKFSGGLRIKIKFDEYVRLHRLVTQISNRDIWECLSQDKPIDEILDRVPDEFNKWVRSVVSELQGAYHTIEQECRSSFLDKGNRKETALYFQTQKYPQVLFAMLDGKDYSPMIWKMVYPKYSNPFRGDE